jgi:short-subunit dehydrogenase
VQKLKEKYGSWALVTGATDGIGLAIAKILSKQGINLVLVGRREALLGKIADELANQNNIKAMVIAVDVGQEDSTNLIVNRTKDLEIGLFIAAAGFGTSGEFSKSSLSNETNMIDVNCKAVVEQCHHFSNLMIKKKRGGIVLFSSLVAFQGTPYSATYSATKAFIQNFAEALHFELKPYGIDVLSSAPGPVNTGFAKRAKMNLGSASSPEEVAQATLDAIGNCVTVRPGFLAKFLGYSLATVNRWGRIQVMKKIMSGMIE